MLIYAVRDIHGHMEAQKQDLARLNFSGDDRLIFLGGYIGGGTEKMIALRGNREEMLLE